MPNSPGNPLGVLESPLPSSDPAPSRSGLGGWLDWSGTSAPVSLLLFAGLSFGPHGINVLSRSVLSSLDPFVPVALAALGVLVGLRVGDRQPDERRLLGAAVLGTATSLMVASSAFAVMLAAATTRQAGSAWTLIATVGICAASSSTLPASYSLQPRSNFARLAGLGVLVPIAAGGFLFAGVHAGSVMAALLLTVQAAGITIALAVAASLLLTHVSSEIEERVIAVSALLLVGGVGEALSLSSLFNGLVAGLCWRYAGGRTRESMGRALLFVQHPLVVVVLLVAGARVELSAPLLGLVAAYVLARLLGQLAGTGVARRAGFANGPRNLPIHFIPGVLGVALALDGAVSLEAEASFLLAIVAVGTIASESVARLLLPRNDRR